MIKRVPVCALLLFVLASFAPAEVIDGIAAVVNDEIITYSELRERTAPVLDALNSADAELRDRIRRRELESLIEEKLVVGKAAELGITVSADEIDEEIAGIKRSLPDEEMFSSFLRGQRMTEKMLRERLEARLLLSRAAEALIMPGVRPPGREEAREFYEENPEMFIEPERLRLKRIIAVPGPETSPAEAEERVESIRRRIEAGEDFSELAVEHSDGPEAPAGGDLGFVSAAEMPPQIQAAVAELEDGGVSGVIRTDQGFSIFMVAGRRGGGRVDFAGAEDAVMRHLFQLRMEEAVLSWLEEIKSKAHIEVRL